MKNTKPVAGEGVCAAVSQGKGSFKRIVVFADPGRDPFGRASYEPVPGAEEKQVLLNSTEQHNN